MRKIRCAALLFAFLLIAAPGLFAGQTVSPELQKANKLFSRKQYSEAIPLYRALASSSPSDAQKSALLLKLADCHFQMGDYRNAAGAYRNALPVQTDAERPQTQYWIGFCALMQGNDAEAVAEFLKIPETYPAAGMWVSTAYYWAGRASDRMGKKEQAQEFFRKAGGKGKSSQERFAMQKAEKVKQNH